MSQERFLRHAARPRIRRPLSRRRVRKKLRWLEFDGRWL